MAAHQAPPSLGFSRQEHQSGLPFLSPMHESEKQKWSHSVVSDSSRPHGLQPIRLLCPWDFPGKNTGVGCHRLLHRDIYTSIFTSQTIYIDIHEFPLYFSFQSTLFFYFFVYASPFSNMRNLMFLIHLFSIYLLHQSYLYVAHFSLYLCSPLIGLSWTPVILSST